MHDGSVIQPTPGQIATLNALLRKSEFLAQQINFPVVSAGVSMMTTLLLDEVGIINATKQFLAEDTLSNFLQFAFVISLLYYFTYTFYQKLTLLTLSTFPQGIGYTRIKHRAYAMQKKLGIRSEVNHVIKDLKKLIVAQESSRAKSYYNIGFFNLIVAMAGILSTGQYRFSLTSSVYGPAFAFMPLTNNITLKLLSRTANYQQGLTFSTYLYKKWDNYDIPYQIKSFLKKLKYISSTAQTTWQMVDDDKEVNIKESTIFLLTLSHENIKFYDHVTPQSHQISKKHYLIEFHRILLEEKMPVYLASDQEIYVGFSELNEKNSKRIQEKFFNRLLIIELHEKRSAEILNILNTSLPNFIVNKNVWKFYIATDDKGQFETIFYLNRKDVHTGLINFYFNALKKALPQSNVIFDGDVISIKIVKDQDFNHFTANFKLEIQSVSYPNISTQTTSRGFVVRGDNSSSSSFTDTMEKENDSSAQKKSPHPDSINFGGGVRFFKDAPTPKPANFAYPMRVPWLAEGKAYVSVDPAAVEALSTYLTKEAVLNPFEKGNVVGPDEHKTNVIQSTNEPYQDVHGQDHITSGYKGKYSNNIRFFCYHADTAIVDGKEYLHYRANGPGFGH